MTDWHVVAEQKYAALPQYAFQRQKELEPMLRSYVDVTDLYGIFLCEVTLILGQEPPKGDADVVIAGSDG